MSDAGEKPPVTFAVCNKGDVVGGGGGGGGSLLSMYAPKRMMMKNKGNNNSRDNEIDTSSHSDAISTNSSPLNEHPPSGSNGATYQHHQQQQRPQPTQLRRQSSPHIDLDDGVNNIDNSNRSSMSGQSRRSSDDNDTDKPLWARLTNQRWHEIGNGEYPLCATDDFDLMVEQLTSVLASRLTAVLIDRLTKARKQGSGGDDGSSSSSINNGREYLQLDMDAGDYVLVDDIMDTLREYVACIGRLHNNVGFHSFEHATHVFLSMNKLLSMITTADDLNVTAKRRLSAQDIATSAFSRSRRSSADSGSSGDTEGHRRHAEQLSFRISEDPAIRFAMVFSALIHDVGHTGVPNSVLIEEEDELAILHNDVSVAEQNSLQLAFSLLQKEEFQLLKRCIGPTPAEHKMFRKKVIGMVMVTDISDQERLQIVKSRWNAAFPPPEEDDKKEEPQQIMEIKSAELKQAARRRRFTMFTSEASALEFANERRSRRLGIRTSMDFSGMMIEAYRDTDQLQQHAVLETMMNVADVAHTMQSFNIFVKWNRKLYKEFYVGHLSGRLPFDPSKNWYENQIGFFSHYIIPLAQKMAKCGVFGSAGFVFEYFAKENRKRWTEEGEEISETIISEVAEEVEREQQQQEVGESVNWAQVAGDRAQNTATPYTPEKWRQQKNMWSGRWGHAVVVFNQSITRSYLTEEENSERARGANPVLVLLGGDDSLPNITSAVEIGRTSGKLRNDVWISSSSQSSWEVDDRYFGDENTLNPQLIRSQMTWREATPGRSPPATWPSGSRVGEPLTYDEWIACQESIIDKMDYTLNLPDPSVCDEPPQFCYENMSISGCHAQGIWKKDNMWSPRRGHSAVVANEKILVIGGRAREYGRLHETNFVGGLGNEKRIETVREYSTIREEHVLKNDIWDSTDGVNWKLVNPGCRDPQEDVLLQTEVWSRDSSQKMTTLVGSAGSKCYKSSECYGVAECKALGNNTREKVCVCPMFQPREQHSVTVQHRFAVNNDGSVTAQDIIYVVGGYINVKQSFCARSSCGPSDGYKLAMDDAWMSSDGGVTWTQIKKAFDNSPGAFTGRGSHEAIVVDDRLLIFGGETFNPQLSHTRYMNDVWQVDLPKEPCCDDCEKHEGCTPTDSDWNMIPNAPWQARSGHTVVYEPPSSSNAFQHRVYLMGGKNDTSIFSDVWTWGLEYDEEWKCDVPMESTNSSQKVDDVFVSIESPLSQLGTFSLPSITSDGQLSNFSPRVSRSIVDEAGLVLMEANGVKTVSDLVSADLYKILKLRGFDYPGRTATAVPNLCLLRDVAIALVNKCSVHESSKSNLDDGWMLGERLPTQVIPMSTLCGVGDDTKPCERGDWDGCSPIPGVSIVDVFGLGDVYVPQYSHNISSIVQELFCFQSPGRRYMGAAQFSDNKVVVMGGVGREGMLLHRDTWTRDDKRPKTVISTKPRSRSPQSEFYFDSNEAGAHVFEYKIISDHRDITPWLITTKNRGVDVSWLDNKKGGNGRGWYTLYTRAVDPAGNRDALFSTEANVYRWYYTPPLPYGVISGCIITFLILVVAAFFEHRRRKRRAILRKFELRRLRRKFKLKSDKSYGAFASSGGVGPYGEQSYNSHQSSSRRQSTIRREERSNQDGSRSRSRHSSSHRSKSRSSRDGHVRRRRKRRSAREEEERLARRRERDKYLGGR